MPGIEFVKGIPTDLEEDWYMNEAISNLIVVDDQMAETTNDKRILNLFTKGSHHRNLSVIFLLQNLFHQGKISQTMSLNSHYLVLFKNPRDKMQVMTLARQMYQAGTETFMRKYEEAVRRPYGYLLIDLKPSSDDRCRLKTDVLPSDPVPKKPKDESGVETLAEFLRKGSYTQSPLVNEMSRLDRQMEQVLKQPGLSADVKAQLYSQNLQRFLSFKNQLRDSLPSGNTTAQPTIAESEVQPASGVKPQAQPTVSPSAQQWWQTLSTPPKQTEEATTVSTPLGIPFPTLSDSTERRIQPPRKRRKPEWFSYIKASPEDKGYYARKREQREKGGRLKIIGKMPEKWTRYIDVE